MRIGWAWPQVFISRVVEVRPRKMPILLLAGGLRSAMWFVIALLTFWMGASRPMLFLGLFLVLYAIATSMMGISNVPWMDIIGKAIPSRARARMFALRRLVGGGMAMISGATISYLLSDRSGISFPSNYAVLFALSGVGTALSIAVFGLIREPIEPVREHRQSLGAYLKSGLELLKQDVNYRRLCLVQFLWAFSMMAMPFYVPYALSDYGLDPVYVGIFVAVMQVSSIVSNVLWAYLGHKKGNRSLLVYGSYFLALSILIPLLADFVPNETWMPLAGWGDTTVFHLRVLFFGLTFVFSGFATSGMFTGRMTYVLDIAPADRRPTYTSFMNMFMLPQGVLPIVAGVLVAWISYWVMFLIALLFIPVTLWLVHRLEDVEE